MHVLDTCSWHQSPHIICDVNILRPKQNRYHFADNILKSIFINDIVYYDTTFAPKGPIDDYSALMALHQTGDKPLLELTHGAPELWQHMVSLGHNKLKSLSIWCCI